MKRFKIGDEVYIERGESLPRIFGVITKIEVVKNKKIIEIQDKNNKTIHYNPDLDKVKKYNIK